MNNIREEIKNLYNATMVECFKNGMSYLDAMIKTDEILSKLFSIPQDKTEEYTEDAIEEDLWAKGDREAQELAEMEIMQ